MLLTLPEYRQPWFHGCIDASAPCICSGILSMSVISAEYLTVGVRSSLMVTVLVIASEWMKFNLVTFRLSRLRFNRTVPFITPTSDGKLTAKNADISGSVNANAGTLNNVTVNENCTIKGMLEATPGQR